MRLAHAIARLSVLDLLTCGTLAVAVYVLAQPLRTRWSQYRADVASTNVARLNWDRIRRRSSPLFDGGAAMQIVEISDYQCPFCRKSSAAVDSAIQRGVAVAYLNFPLPSHLHAEGAAIAALCAESVGRFREMHARLMSTTEWQLDSNWLREANAAGISNLTEFRKCLGEPAVRHRLDQQRDLAEKLGIHGTPMFVSRVAVHRGAASMSQLLALGRRK